MQSQRLRICDTNHEVGTKYLSFMNVQQHLTAMHKLSRHTPMLQVSNTTKYEYQFSLILNLGEQPVQIPNQIQLLDFQSESIIHETDDLFAWR